MYKWPTTLWEWGWVYRYHRSFKYRTLTDKPAQKKGCFVNPFYGVN